jgi:hypothetical protein
MRDWQASEVLKECMEKSFVQSDVAKSTTFRERTQAAQLRTNLGSKHLTAVSMLHVNHASNSHRENDGGCDADGGHKDVGAVCAACRDAEPVGILVVIGGQGDCIWQGSQ